MIFLVGIIIFILLVVAVGGGEVVVFLGGMSKQCLLFVCLVLESWALSFVRGYFPEELFYIHINVLQLPG